MDDIQQRREKKQAFVQWYSSGLTMSGQLMFSMAGVFKHVLRKRAEIYKIKCIDYAKENRIREKRKKGWLNYSCVLWVCECVCNQSTWIKTALFESDKLCIHRPLGCYRDIYIHLSNKEIKWISLSRLFHVKLRQTERRVKYDGSLIHCGERGRSQAALHKAPRTPQGVGMRL